MDLALQNKNVPQFVAAYHRAVQFQKDLAGISPDLTGLASARMETSLKVGLDGDIYTLVASNQGILQNWPESCYSNSDTKDLVRTLIDFNQRRWAATTAKEERPKHTSGHLIYHDDSQLLLAQSRQIPNEQVGDKERTYFKPDSIISNFNYNPRSKVIGYSLTTSTREGISGSLTRECNFIDLGADGLDRCDALLNGFPDTPEGIASANSKAANCMRKTIDVLKVRYAGTGFI
ncbi:MAG: hypothetical protein AABX04_03820 [Nanoarchaeota archaeon]